MSDTAREIIGWVYVFSLALCFLGAAYALYAWFKLRDKPTAIQMAGSTLIVFSTILAKWFDVVAMIVGLGIAWYGTVLLMRRGGYRRMTDEALARFGPPRSPDEIP